MGSKWRDGRVPIEKERNCKRRARSSSKWPGRPKPPRPQRVCSGKAGAGVWLWWEGRLQSCSNLRGTGSRPCTRRGSWGDRKVLPPPQTPSFPPQANLPSPSAGPWEPWDTKVSRDPTLEVGRKGGAEMEAEAGPISLGEEAARLHPGLAGSGKAGEAGYLTRPSASDTDDQVWKWPGTLPAHPSLAWPGSPSLPAVHTPPAGRSQGKEKGGGGGENSEGQIQRVKMDDTNLRGGQRDPRCPGWAEWAEATT